uniref:NADPH--cytochrome P450 reductase n=1 Tax=Caenorhabditis japonica TaxID=281687 RepID=A0A8R1DSH1_CAEJA
MLTWIVSGFDTSDIVVLTLFAGGAIVFVFMKLLNQKPAVNRYSPTVTSVTPSTVVPSKLNQSFIDRMKNEGRQVLIMYGSQTGTAEEMSGRLAKDLSRYSKKAVVVDPEDIDCEDLNRLSEVEDALLVLCIATYGEGDPTDNAVTLVEYLNGGDCDLSGVRFAVFGLGNKTYEHFNEIGKQMDKQLEKLGAKRIFQLGLGDDDANLEEDFMIWREAFLPKVAEEFGWELNTEAETMRQYQLEPVEEGKALFRGEFGRLGAYERPRPPFDAKNPYLARVVVNDELHTDQSDRSCRHIEFSVEGSRIRYEAGDHLAVFPTNDSSLVDRLIEILDFEPDRAFRLVNVDEDASKRHPFPCPTTFRTALSHYVDICAPVKSHVLKAISEYCSDEGEKEYLNMVSTANEAGLKEYARYIVKERRSVVDVLTDHKSCKPPIEYLLELLPRLQARYYSIASCPRINEEKIAICAVVTKYSIGDRLINGVCTTYLLNQLVESKSPIFVRKSTMRLPHRTTTQVIMIGPGTGFAPFRGFLQDRQFHKTAGKEVGAMHLYYGCRHPDHDYIYRDEIAKFHEDRVLTHLECAFSRAQEKKIYVQDRLWDTRDRVWEAINSGAHVYICGDARNMARDVQATLQKIFREIGGKSENEAVAYFKDMEKTKRYQADVWS